MQRLKGLVAVVTGASRGAGRGIAQVLGEEGATVYVTGRSVSGATTRDWPGTIEDTAEAVTVRGGLGIPVRCDHTKDDEVRALFERVHKEQGKLDLLVNNAFGGSESGGPRGPFWVRPVDCWDTMFTAGVRASLMASYFAAPILVAQGRGLIVNTTFLFDHYGGFLQYDLAKAALIRLAFCMAQDLKPHGVAAVAVSPGWMRTELVLAHFGATEETWRQFPPLTTTESTEYVGRAIAALAADPQVMAKTGQVLKVGDLAMEYGFTDIDGRQVPPYVTSEA